MTCWTAAERVAELLQLYQQKQEIIDILESFSFEQRRFIISMKYAHSSLLFIAVKRKHVSSVRYFLENCGAEVDSLGWRHKEKLTCLCLAVMLNSEIIIDILLKHGANTEILSSHRKTALQYAFKNDRLEIVKILIKHGANLNNLDCSGKSCLVDTISYLNLCKYSMSVLETVNLASIFRRIPIWYGNNERIKIISFFLSCTNTDVRLKTNLEDVLNFAVAYFSTDVIDAFIRKGVYTKDEVIKGYELQSCNLYISDCLDVSRELWKKALQLRSKPENTPMFKNPHKGRIMHAILDRFNADHIPALLYLESVYGIQHKLVLQAFALAACKVTEIDKFIILFNHFVNTVRSFDDEYFFLASNQVQPLLSHYFKLNIRYINFQALLFFKTIVAYIVEIRARLERMTPLERIPHANEVESILLGAMRMICQFECYSENLNSFHKGISLILKANLRGLNQKSLLHFCANGRGLFRIVRILLECGADVNSTDIEGKTVLHDFVEVQIASKAFIETLIDYGFDFSQIKYNEYCLPCRMERERILPNPVKYVTLQCLATKSFCEKTMNSFSDVPHHLMAVINSHLYLPCDSYLFFWEKN